MNKGDVIIRQVIGLLVALTLGIPIPLEAGVFWEEDFENHLAPIWDTTACPSAQQLDGCNAVISRDVAHSGSHSLKSHFDVSCQAPGCGTYYDRYIPQSNDVWMRWWYRTANFTYWSNETKLFYIKSDGGWLVVWGTMHGNREMEAQIWHAEQTAFCPSTRFVDTACNYFNNVGHVPLNDNQWYCIEAHAHAGTNGVADGRLEIWVDGVQTMNHTGVLLRSSPGNYTFIRQYTQNGLGDRYIDEVAVGNTRIGCNGNPSVDTRPPAAPTGLGIH